MSVHPVRLAKRQHSTALVLSGGGARGAYQVGALRGLLELGLIPARGRGFDIVIGASAGALNAGMLAGYASELDAGVQRLEQLWGSIEPQQVFRTDLRSLGGIGLRWARDLSFGGTLRRVAPKALLDTSPLRRTLEKNLSPARIRSCVSSGALDALSVSATDLYTANGTVFVDGRPDLELWERGRWRIERVQIGPEHLMASSAIPIFFPSVEIDGRHYGDGCIRNTAPLRPAIHLGADRVVAIGVREPGSQQEGGPPADLPPPSIARIAGVLLDAVMLDAIEADVEHSDRVNRSLIACQSGDPENPFRMIDVLWLSPSCEFGSIAGEHSDRIPAIVRYLMRGLGDDAATVELASYLLFDAVFCNRLMEIGRNDVFERETEMREFFEDEGPPHTAGNGTKSHE